MTAKRPQYDWAHRKERNRRKQSMGWLGYPCNRCGVPLGWEDGIKRGNPPRDNLHLDHATDELGNRLGDHVYLPGLSHARCNQAANAFASNKDGARRLARSAVRTPTPTPGGKSPGREW